MHKGARILIGIVVVAGLCRITPSAEKKPVLVAQDTNITKQITSSSIAYAERQNQEVSRGNVDRDKSDKVIKAINSELNGLLEGKGQVFYEAGKLENVNPMLLAAIAKHETRVKQNGAWVCNSNVLREANNVAGINWNRTSIFERYGRYNKYPSIDKSIYDMAEKLKYFYINEGKTDISSIGAKWAPMNDYQQGMYGMDNSIWAKEVTEIYNKILKKSEG